jgi:hypothetical protein
LSFHESSGEFSSHLRVSTPDGRYDVVRGKLQRRSNPRLTTDQRALLVARLRDAEQRIRAVTDDYLAVREARAAAAQVLVELGERGPVWWSDGTPDLHGQPVDRSPYGKWWDDRRRVEVWSRV